MAALITFCLRKSHNLGKLFLPHRRRTLQNYLPLIETSRCLTATARPDRKHELRLRIHERLDHNFGVSTQLFNSLLSTIEKSGSLTEDDLTLLLHICGSGPFDSSSNTRLQFVENIWSKVEEQSMRPTSKLYNMKLKAYSLNEKAFSPLDELTAMKSLGVNPDKITFGLLIDAFCRNGDVAGANHVLEAMNNANLVVGINVFNSFITGHLKTGSIQEAQQVLETMRSRGLTSNSDTYYRFVRHYAEKGDIDSVLKYIQEAESDSKPLDPNTLMKVYRLLLLNGHMDEANQIIPLLKEKDVFRSYTMQNLCQLVAEGFHDEALDLFFDIPRTATENVFNQDGHFLLKCMVNNDMNAKDIYKVADKLREDLPHTLPLSQALFFAYRANKHEIGVKFLEEMSAQNHDLTVPMLLPVLCHYRDNKDLEGVYKTVDKILSLDPCEETFDALIVFCYPILVKMGQSKEDILAKLKKHEAKWNTFFMLKELQKAGWAAALESVSHKPLNDDLVKWIGNNILVLSKWPQEEKQACFELIAKLMRRYNLNRFLALDLIRHGLRVQDVESVHSFLDVLKQKGVRLPSTVAFGQAPQDLQDKISEMSGPQRSAPISTRSMKELREMSLEDLEGYVKVKPNHTLAHVALLNKAVADKNLPEIQKKLSEVRALNFAFQKDNLTNITLTLADLGDVKTALICFKELQERFEFEYKDTVPLSLAVMLVKAGDTQGALEMIDIAKEADNSLRNSVFRIRKIIDLLNSVKTVEEAESIHNALVKGRKYVGEDAKVAHHFYMKKVIESCDDKDLLQRLAALKNEHWVFPCMDIIISRFIQKEDIESLKKVMDIGISVVGTSLFHHKLACNFIICGMPSKAAAIFENMGEKLHTRHVEKSCEYFIKNKQVEHVATLVEMVKLLPVSRTAMLEQLIKAHLSENALGKAVEVLETFESEFLVPKRSSLDTLVAAYKKQNQEHPEILTAFLSRTEILDQTQPEES